MKNPRDRFTEKADDYKKFRPGYPDSLIVYLAEKCGLTDKSLIADVGSGTGIFSRLLLEQGLNVFAVEPNEAMRIKAETDLNGFEKFKSINAGAEDLPFEDSSIDLITVAQAFHWFDRGKCKVEFKRVLKTEGYAALIWNERLHDTEFLVDFELLLKNNLEEYKCVDHKNITIEVITDFFLPNEFEIVKRPINQGFNLEDFIGRVISSSYAPQYGTKEGDLFINALTDLFNKHKQNNQVEFRYDSTMYLGKLN